MTASALLQTTAFTARRSVAFVGPAALVGLGYIDPGNWGTDMAAGVFGYRLLWVVACASLLGIALQIWSVHLTLSTGTSLAAAIARQWPGYRIPLWSLYQLSCIATDLGEFCGIALGFQLLLRWPISLSLAAAAVTVFALLAFRERRKSAAHALLALMLISIVAAALYEAARVHIDAPAVLRGLLTPHFGNGQAMLVALGILGATIMPHNLFLHSKLVVDENSGNADQRRGPRWLYGETAVVLAVVGIANLAIVVFGAAYSGKSGSIDGSFSAMLANSSFAAVTFGIALILSGIGVAATTTLTSDFLCSGFQTVRIPVLLRRSVTIGGSVVLLSTGISTPVLLIGSQVVLGLVLPTVVVPMLFLHLAQRRKKELYFSRPTTLKPEAEYVTKPTAFGC